MGQRVTAQLAGKKELVCTSQPGKKGAMYQRSIRKKVKNYLFPNLSQPRSAVKGH